MKDIGRVIFWVVVGILVLMALRWAYAEYYIATHCTTVLGTRVCQ